MNSLKLCDHPDYGQKEKGHKHDFNCLPVERQRQIFSYLSYDDHRNMAQVCKTWNTICHDPALWAPTIDSDQWTTQDQCLEGLKMLLHDIFDVEWPEQVVTLQAVNIATTADGADSNNCLQLFSNETSPYAGQKIMIGTFQFNWHSLSADGARAVESLFPCAAISIVNNGTGHPLQLDKMLAKQRVLESMSLSNQTILWKENCNNVLPLLTRVNLAWTLDSCQIISGLLATCPNVTDASFQITNFRRQALEAICLASLQKIEYLRVEAVNGDGDEIINIGQSESPVFPKSLKQLILTGSGMNKSTFCNMSADFSRLEVLEISIPKLNTTEFLHKFQPFPKVFSLNVRKNIVDEKMPQCIKLFPNLEILDIGYTTVNVYSLHELLRNGPKLHTVELAMTKVYPRDEDALSLRHKDITFNGFEVTAESMKMRGRKMSIPQKRTFAPDSAYQRTVRAKSPREENWQNESYVPNE